MTKAQNFTFTFLDNFLTSEKTIISWRELSDAVQAKHKVKNFMSIRNVLQVYINEESLVRTSDLNVEEYKKVHI